MAPPTAQIIECNGFRWLWWWLWGYLLLIVVRERQQCGHVEHDLVALVQCVHRLLAGHVTCAVA